MPVGIEDEAIVAQTSGLRGPRQQRAEVDATGGELLQERIHINRVSREHLTLEHQRAILEAFFNALYDKGVRIYSSEQAVAIADAIADLVRSGRDRVTPEALVLELRRTGELADAGGEQYVLGLLAEQPCHGYDLRKRLSAPAVNLSQEIYLSEPLPQTTRVMVKDEDGKWRRLTDADLVETVMNSGPMGETWKIQVQDPDIQAAKYFIDQAIDKAVDRTEVTGAEGEPLVIKWKVG